MLTNMLMPTIIKETIPAPLVCTTMMIVMDMHVTDVDYHDLYMRIHI